MKATGLLTEEHQYILRAINVIERMASRTAQGDHLGQEDV
jgi:hemerythrin-like domain-containing protein